MNRKREVAKETEARQKERHEIKENTTAGRCNQDRRDRRAQGAEGARAAMGSTRRRNGRRWPTKTNTDETGSCMEAEAWRSYRIVIGIVLVVVLCKTIPTGSGASTYPVSGRKKGCQRHVSPSKVSHKRAGGARRTEYTYWGMWAWKTLFLCFLLHWSFLFFFSKGFFRFVSVVTIALAARGNYQPQEMARNCQDSTVTTPNVQTFNSKSPKNAKNSPRHTRARMPFQLKFFVSCLPVHLTLRYL